VKNIFYASVTQKKGKVPTLTYDRTEFKSIFSQEKN
jgi:hypothetical protein